MPKMRQMVVQGPAASGPQRGQWREFDPDGLTPLELHNRLNSREVYVEVFRNGGWRPASMWAVPGWQRAGEQMIDSLRGRAEQIRRKAESPVVAAEGNLTAAKNRLRAAAEAIKDAEGTLKTAKEAERKAEAEAQAVDREKAAAEKDLTARLKAYDSASEAPAAVPA